MDGSWLRRRYIYTRTYLLNPFRPAIFGLPFMFRMQPELTSGEQLYSLVWSNCKRFIRRSASKAPSRAGSRAASPVYVSSLSPCAIGGKCHQQCCQSLHTTVCLRVLLTTSCCRSMRCRGDPRDAEGAVGAASARMYGARPVVRAAVLPHPAASCRAAGDALERDESRRYETATPGAVEPDADADSDASDPPRPQSRPTSASRAAIDDPCCTVQCSVRHTVPC
jgi:hypothetical protein